MSSYLADTYYVSWIYVVKDWSVSTRQNGIWDPTHVLRLATNACSQTRDYNFFINT